MHARSLVICLYCFVAMLPTAQASEAEEVEATGQAAIFDNDEAQARDKALEDAQRKAIESTLGTMISSETLTENYQLISDRILAKADGYVRKYRILDERKEDGVYIVEIKAWVAKGDVTSDLEALQVLMQRKGMPKMLIMISEQNIGMERPAYWWHTRGRWINMDIVENTIMETMREKGFTFIDTDVLSGEKSVSLPAVDPSNQQAQRIAKLTEAQVVLVGKAIAKDLGKKVLDTDWRSANADVSVRAINTDNGEIIAVATESAIVPHISVDVAGKNALKKASQQIADKLIQQISNKWTSDTSATTRIRMEVSGLKNHQMLSKFINVLKTQVRSVKEVHEQKFKKGTAILDVMLAGKTRAMATELEAKDFGGAFKIEVEKVTNQSITLKLLP